VDAAALWGEAYQGEVLGEAFFQLLSERQTDPDRRHELEVLAELERSTKRLAEPVLDRHGYDRGDSAETVRTATDAVDNAVAAPWEDNLRTIVVVAESFLPKYQQLVELSDDDQDREVARAYVAHEQALMSYARRALGEEAGDPLEQIAALPHVAPNLAG
jgi:hypothetical protein